MFSHNFWNKLNFLKKNIRKWFQKNFENFNFKKKFFNRKKLSKKIIFAQIHLTIKKKK